LSDFHNFSRRFTSGGDRPEKKKGKRKKADVADKNGKPKRQGRRKRYQLSISSRLRRLYTLAFLTSALTEPFAVFILFRFFCFFSLSIDRGDLSRVSSVGLAMVRRFDRLSAGFAHHKCSV